MSPVKLVSEPGRVGTIATGVAKAYADLITIAGYDGGHRVPAFGRNTLAARGNQGLAETQQALSPTVCAQDSFAGGRRFENRRSMSIARRFCRKFSASAPVRWWRWL